jgi:hypothetical protein
MHGAAPPGFAVGLTSSARRQSLTDEEQAKLCPYSLHPSYWLRELFDVTLGERRFCG